MKPIFFTILLICLSTVHANEKQKSEDRGDGDDAVAHESFNSPVYGGPIGLSGKGYPLPAAPVLPAGYALPPAPAIPVPPTSYSLPAAAVPPTGYTTYLNSLDYAASPYRYGNAYNRYSLNPYTTPYYGYGSYDATYGSYSAPYGAYGAQYAGYPAGLTYGNPSTLGRSAAGYNAYAYPGYGGYRYGGLGYNAGVLRGPAVPVAGVPARVAAVPAAGISAYAAPAVAPPGKGFPYGYAPLAPQKLPLY